MCFEILGFDVILDSDCKPYLLEVNHAPSFLGESKIDLDIKYELIKDSLNLLNLDLTDRKLQIAKL